MNEHINKHKITVNKTAEIITSGILNEHTKSVWIVLHGYGQLPEYFIQNFKNLNNIFIIAPSGLSRAYIKGFNGRVGANWMTSHERGDEITDYVKYLNQIISYFDLENLANVDLNVLGFSQGGATACRFVDKISASIKNLILWGALIPDELENSATLLKNKITVVHGSEDEFILPQKEVFLKKLETYKKKGIIAIEYKGTHRIPRKTFNELNLKYWV